MPSDYIIVESSGTPLLEQVMVFVIKTIGKSTSEITSILSSLPSAAMGGSVAIAEDASAAWMKGLNGTWGKIGSDAGGLPAGGTVGQYIKKLSAAYGDAAWETPDTTPTLNSTKLITSGGVNTAINALNDKIIHFGTETDYPLSAAHTAYPMGVTLIYTAANTSYPYGTGTVVTIRSANARCVQFSFGNSPDNYKLRTADSSGWSDWKSLKDVPGITDLQKAIGIVVDGDKAATNVTLDQFVILKNSTISSRADGLYTAAKPIPANTAIDKTYLTAVTGGGLNALTSKYDTVDTASITWDSNHTPTRSDLAIVYKKGQMCQMIFWNVSFANNITSDTTVGTIPAGYRPPEKTSFFGYNRQHELCRGWIGTDGVIRISLFQGDLMYISCTYIARY